MVKIFLPNEQKWLHPCGEQRPEPLHIHGGLYSPGIPHPAILVSKCLCDISNLSCGHQTDGLKDHEFKQSKRCFTCPVGLLN